MSENRESNAPHPRKGLAYSPIADIALVIGRIASLFGVVASVLHFFVETSEGNIGEAVMAALAFFLCLAGGVVFVRVQDL